MSSPNQSSQTLKDQWVTLINYKDETAKAFGPKGFISIMKRWGDTIRSPFHRPREDPCISPLFDILKTKEKAKFEQNTSTAAASAAAGHAVLTAWDCAKSTVKELDAALKCFRRNPDGVSKESDRPHRRFVLGSLGYGVPSTYRRSFDAQFAARQNDCKCSKKHHRCGS